MTKLDLHRRDGRDAGHALRYFAAYALKKRGGILFTKEKLCHESGARENREVEVLSKSRPLHISSNL